MKNIVEWSAVQTGDTVTLHNRDHVKIKRTLEFVVETAKYEYGIHFLGANGLVFADTAWAIVAHEVAEKPEPAVGSLVIIVRHSDEYREVWYRRENGWTIVTPDQGYGKVSWSTLKTYRTNAKWKYEEVEVND